MTDDDYHDLYEATMLVAREFDGPHCVDAAALLVELGARLGYDLDAVPVALAAFGDNGHAEATGEKGRAFAMSYLQRNGGHVDVGGDFEGGSPFQRRAGHMVVHSRERRLLLDPTFSQFKMLGNAAVGLFVTEIDPRAGGKFWEVGDDTFFARYFVENEYMSELDFDKVRAAYAPRADELLAEVERRLIGA